MIKEKERITAFGKENTQHTRMRKNEIDPGRELDKRYEVYTHTQISIDFIAYNIRYPL